MPSVDEMMQDLDAADKAGDKELANHIAQKIKEAQQSHPKSSEAKAFGKAAVESTLPAVGGFAGAVAGGGLIAPVAGAAAAATAAGGVTAPAAPIVGGAVELTGVVVGSFAGAAGVAKLQNMVTKHIPESLKEKTGFGEQQRAQEEQEHPYISFAGHLAPNLLMMQPGKGIQLAQRSIFAGVGGSLEAGQEYIREGKIDPKKVIMAAAANSIMTRNTKLGQGVQDLVSVIGKSVRAPAQAKFVAEATNKLGPEYKEAASAYFESKVPPKAQDPKAAQKQHQRYGIELEDAFQISRGKQQADVINAIKQRAAIPKEDLKILNSEQLYSLQPGEGGTGPITPKQKELQDKYIEPLKKEAQDTYNKIIKLTGKKPEESPDYNPRVTQESALSKFGKKLQRIGEFGYAAKANAAKPRSMFVAEENGTSSVVSVKGNKVYSISKNANGNVTRELLGTAKEKPEVGKEFVVTKRDKGIFASRILKLKQGTTEQIEAASNIKYVKNTYDNWVTTNLQLSRQLAEATLLKEYIGKARGLSEPLAVTVKSRHHGYAPEGEEGAWQKLDHPILDKYYFHPRMANILKDNIGKGAKPDSVLAAANNMLTGTMFYSPFGHLLNAADHYFNTVGWSLANPFKSPSLARSIGKAFTDVRTQSPEYLRLLSDGAGLQYGRVIMQEALDGALKDIDHRSIGEVAKEWGKSGGAELIKDIYNVSRKSLWAGSDMMMMSAYRFMAEGKGKDIGDQMIRQYVETHNPNYRIPSNVGIDSLLKIPGMPEKVAYALSRGMSNIMQSRVWNTFGRYHYGQMKSLGHDIKDMAVQSSMSPQTRMQALSHLSFVAFNLAVVYPYLWDRIAKSISGKQDVEMKRSGASSIPDALWKIVMKDESVLSALKEVVMLPVGTRAVAELAESTWNKRSPVRKEPVKWAASKITPVKQAQDIIAHKKTLRQTAQEQLGIRKKKHNY